MAKERSPNYPAIGLSDAVASIKTLYAKEKRTPVPGLVAAKAIGYGSLSGPARVKLAALKKYGLLEGDESKGLRVSDLGMRILFPPSVEEEDSSRKEAALKPELFRSLYENFADGSDDALRSYLITRLQFGATGARQVIAAFRDTISFANLQKADYNASDMSEKIEARLQADRANSATPFDTSGFGRPFQTKANTTKIFTWPLSKGVTAEVRFTGGEVQTSHLELLAKYLELAKIAIEADDDNHMA
jgi:hypothetical protein